MTLVETMDRSGAEEARGERAAGPLRRCIATGVDAPRRHLLRFVLSPDGALTPDIAARLPGRGAWLTPSAAAIEAAVKNRLFNRAFGGPVTTSEDLAVLIERLLAARMVDTLGLARRAGQAVSGHDKVEEWIARGRARIVLVARNAADNAQRRARAPEGGALIRVLGAEEIGRAFAKERAVHAALAEGELGRKLIDDSIRLAGLRPPVQLAGLRPPGDERGSERA